MMSCRHTNIVLLVVENNDSLFVTMLLTIEFERKYLLTKSLHFTVLLLFMYMLRYYYYLCTCEAKKGKNDNK